MKQTTYIGIGASAGGLDALQKLLLELPADSNFVYIVVQHLSKERKSLLPSILSKSTTIPVIEPKVGEVLEGGNLYVIPPECTLKSIQNKLMSVEAEDTMALPHPSIDDIFTSLAHAKGSDAIGIILSGTGHDGTQGLSAIHAAGGISIAQLPSEAEYDSMPHGAIISNVVDQILPVGAIAKVLQGITNSLEDSDIKALQAIRHILHLNENMDLQQYKEKTVQRRLHKRMLLLNIKTLRNYVYYLLRNRLESKLLYQDLLIGVTSFFREPEAFEALKKELRMKLKDEDKREELRVWVTACSTGEEAYSLAIMLLELKKELQLSFDIRIFATDIDTIALKEARKGLYTVESLREVPSYLLHTYFTLNGDFYEVSSQLRDVLLFTQHDLLKDPPFLKMDLITCRNALIYFTPTTQQEVFTIFYNALNEKGILFLGISESATQHVNYFKSLDTQWKIYMKEQLTNPPKLPKRFFQSYKTVSQPIVESVPLEKRFSDLEEVMLKSIYEFFIPNSIVINKQNEIIFTKGKIPYLEFSQGFASLNLYKNLHSGLHHEMRLLLNECILDSKPCSSKFVEVDDIQEHPVFVRILAMPILLKPDNNLTVLYFQEISSDEMIYASGSLAIPTETDIIASLQTQLSGNKTQLSALQDEYELLNENMQMIHEELQSSNEELHASNEELETSNEELQSSNEELAKSFMQVESLQKQLTLLLESIPEGVVGFDNGGKHTFINNAASKMLGYSVEFLIGREGHSLWHHSRPDGSHYPYNECPIEQVRQTMQEIRGFEHFWNSNGTLFEVSYVCSPIFEDNKIVGSVLFFHDVTKQRELEHAIAREQERSKRYLDVAGVIMLVLDREANIVLINKKGAQVLQESVESIIGKNWIENYIDTSIREEIQNVFDEEIHLESIGLQSYTNEIVTSTGEHRLIFWKNSAVEDENGRIINVISAGTDITEMTTLKNRLLETEQLYSLTFENANIGIANVSLDGEWIEVNKQLCEILGYTKSELLSMTFQDITFADDLEKDLHYVQDLLDGKIQKYSMEKRYIKRDKSLVWVNLSVALIRDSEGKAEYFVSVIEDKSEEKRLQQQAKESEEKLRLFIKYTPAALAMFDTQMNYLEVSHGWREEYHLGDKDIIGKNHYELFPDLPQDLRVTHQRSLKGEVLRGENYKYAREDGRVYYATWETRPWYLNDNEIGGIIIYTIDVTKQNELLISLREQEDLMIAQSRLAAMGEMLSMIAHQWRQPLTIISLGAQNLLLDLELGTMSPEKIKEESHHILKQTQYLSKTIDDFRNFFKADKVKEKVLIKDIIDESLEVIGKSLQAHQIVCSIENNSNKKVSIFSRELQQVIINILKNAQEALIESGQKNPRIEIKIKEEFDYIDIEICNNGGSIEKQTMHRIFEPYFSTKEERNGTGLGLYMSKTIIEKHMDGRLEAKNIKDGVCFIIAIASDENELNHE